MGGNLVVGESGPGRLTLMESPQATLIDVAGAMLIGTSLPPAGHGTVIVEGDVTTTNDSLISSTLGVPDGDIGSGELTLLTGARVTTTTTATIGTESAGSNARDGKGVVALEGTAGADEFTRWQIGESLTIGASTGQFGTGALVIRDATVKVGTTERPVSPRTVQRWCTRSCGTRSSMRCGRSSFRGTWSSWSGCLRRTTRSALG